MKHFIYVMCDPVEIYKVCYVGESSDPYRRFIEHLSDVHKDTAKGQWLRSLREEGKVPYMKIIEITDTELAREREAYWINFYLSLNIPLVNASLPAYIQQSVGAAFTPKKPAKIVKPENIKDTILELHREGITHREICKKVGLYGAKYSQYKEICKQLGIDTSQSA